MLVRRNHKNCFERYPVRISFDQKFCDFLYCLYAIRCFIYQFRMSDLQYPVTSDDTAMFNNVISNEPCYSRVLCITNTCPLYRRNVSAVRYMERDTSCPADHKTWLMRHTSAGRTTVKQSRSM